MGQAALAKPKNGKAGKPGRKRQDVPVTLPQGDTGPDTGAQMRGAEIVPMHAKGGEQSGWRFRRRLHELQWMARAIGPDGKKKPRELREPREVDAGMELFERAEAVRRHDSGTSVFFRPYVDSSRKPGDVDVERLEAWSKYRELEAVIPQESLLVVRFVCCFNRPLSEWSTDEDNQKRALALLRDGLRAVARVLRY